MKFKVKSIVEYILVVLFIIQCNSMYSRAAGGVEWLNALIPMIGIQIILLITSRTIPTSLIRSLSFFLTAYYIIQCLNLAFNMSANMNREFIVLNIVILPLCIIMATLQIYMNELEGLLNKFSQAVAVLAVMSLFFWLFGSVLHLLRPTGAITNVWADGVPALHYYRLHFETQKVSVFGHIISRNTGVFVEGPMWNLVLSLAFTAELFIRKQPRRNLLILFAITIWTTFSTTGIYVLGLSFIAYYMVLRKNKYKFVAIPVMIPVVYGLSQVLGGKSASESGTIRMDDYVAGLNAWLERWLAGWGQNGLARIQYHMNTHIRPSLGYSNSLFIVLAKGGVLQGFAQLLPIIGVIVLPRVPVKIRVSAGLLMVLVITVIFQNTAIYCFAVAMCYAGAINLIRVK